jgi:peroxiredoxin family protein
MLVLEMLAPPALSESTQIYTCQNTVKVFAIARDLLGTISLWAGLHPNTT